MSEQYIGLVGDGSQEDEADVDLVRRHLAGLVGLVLDLGCGPGHWTSYLHSLGADVTRVLSWYSTIHLSPSELDSVLAEFRRLLKPSGVLLAGFFDSDDDVAQFDHKVIAAYRWPADAFAACLAKA